MNPNANPDSSTDGCAIFHAVRKSSNLPASSHRTKDPLLPRAFCASFLRVTPITSLSTPFSVPVLLSLNPILQCISFKESLSDLVFGHGVCVAHQSITDTNLFNTPSLVRYSFSLAIAKDLTFSLAFSESPNTKFLPSIVLALTEYPQPLLFRLAPCIPNDLHCST